MKKIILALIIACFLTINYQLNAQELQANVTINEMKDPGLIKIPETKNINDSLYKEKSAQDNIEYERIKKEIGEENFELYKILERIVRANNLQYQSWRIAFIMDIEEINAYASSYNLLSVYSAIYDVLYPNEDAIAFVIAHELSHHLYNHNKASIPIEARILELQEKIKNAKMESKKQQNYAYWNSMFENDTAAMAHSFSDTAIAINLQILEKKLNKEFELLRDMEYQADSEAIVLMARANYDTSKAFDTIELIDKLSGIETKYDTHPSPQARLNNIKSKMAMINQQQLRQQGKCNLYNSKVLNSKKTTDKKGIILLQDENFKKVSLYTPQTKDVELIQKGYLNYKNKDLNSAESDFKKAYETNPASYISPLYLSYINEYLYSKSQDKKLLKEAKYWANKAYKIEQNENTTKQKEYLQSFE